MLAELLILTAAAQGLDAIDDANLALTRCGFEAHRFAAARDQSLDQFERSLSSRCSAEIARMRQLATEFHIARKGQKRAEAMASADALIALFRKHFRDGYARRKESEAQLQALERALRQEGHSNAQ